MHPFRLSSRRLDLAATGARAHHDKFFFAMDEDWTKSVCCLRSSNLDQRVGLPEFQTYRFSKGPKCSKDRSRRSKPLGYRSRKLQDVSSLARFWGLPRFVRNDGQPALASFSPFSSSLANRFPRLLCGRAINRVLECNLIPNIDFSLQNPPPVQVLGRGFGDTSSRSPRLNVMHHDREARLGAIGFCELLPYVHSPVYSELLTPPH